MKRKQRGRPPKTEEQKASIRKRIVDGARTLFVEEGFEKVSMRKLAAKVGLTPTTLYHYFRNKRNILHFLWDDLFLQVSESCMAAVKGINDPISRIRGIMTRYVTYWLEHPDHFRVIFMIEDLSSTLAEDLNSREMMAGMEAFQALVSAIEKGIEKEQILGNDTEIIWQGLFTQAHGIVSCLITVREISWRPAHELIEQSIGTTLRGMICDGSAICKPFPEDDLPTNLLGLK